MHNYICVIGGANVDISATPYGDLNKGDSVPGKSNISFGGVGRNISENIAKLDIAAEFITVIGDDMNSTHFKQDCKRKSINISNSLELKSTYMSTYVCINDCNGEMQWAVSNMDIYDYLTPEYISGYLNLINSADACIIDTNIPEKTISYIAENCKVPLFVDTVSINKATKIKSCLSKIHTLKPNLLEAQLLTGMKVKSYEDLKKCADWLLKEGIKNVYISLGEKGVFCTDGKTYELIPCFKTSIVNTTGAGDSFIAGLVYSYLKGFNIIDSTKLGLASAAMCISSKEAVSDKLSCEALEKMLRFQEANYEC